MSEKRIAMIGRIGPAFSLKEIERAHTELDRIGVPREFDGETLRLNERIAYLCGFTNALSDLTGYRLSGAK